MLPFFSLAKAPLEITKEGGIGVAERIDALLDITHYEEVVAMGMRLFRHAQQFDQSHLQRVGILEFIYHEMPEASPIAIPDARRLFQQPHAFRLKILHVQFAPTTFGSSVGFPYGDEQSPVFVGEI